MDTESTARVHLFDDSDQIADMLLEMKSTLHAEGRHELLYTLGEAATHISALYEEALEQQAEIDALKAQNAELLSAQQWQPMEHAPKDGRAIVVLDAQNAMFVAYWHSNPQRIDGGDFRTFDKYRKRLAPEILLGWTALSVPDYDELEAKARGEL